VGEKRTMIFGLALSALAVSPAHQPEHRVLIAARIAKIGLSAEWLSPRPFVIFTGATVRLKS